MLTRNQFDEFFGAAHGGVSHGDPPVEPYPWQRELLNRLLERGEWPERIVAPTGSGKTSVIDVHVFAQALMAADDRIRPPRRLFMVVDRRVLVDDQHQYALSLAGRLARATDGVLKQVCEALLGLREVGPALDARIDTDQREPLVVARLRGGTIPDRTWLDDPTAAAIICATPEMWGSRLLFRGYGSSYRAWPREAGLMAVDSVVVVDEAHLARQLVVTARRVRQLVPIGASPNRPALPALQVVETTATPTAAVSEDASNALSVGEADLAVDALARRLKTPKAVRVREVDGWAAKVRTVNVAAQIADEVLVMVERTSTIGADVPGSVGCFLNSVRTAVAVATTLTRRAVEGRKLNVALVCGQVRPSDVAALTAAHPNLLTVAGDPDIDVIVSTQSLEVGVDLDLVGIVTELASGSALAQRAGRVNRRGLRRRGDVVVIAPTGSVEGPVDTVITEKFTSGPYDHEELRAAIQWVLRLPALGDGARDMCPSVLTMNPPPPANSRRHGLFQRPELADVWLWSRTSDLLAIEIDLRLWLADDYETDLSAGLAVREQMPVDSADAIQLVRDLRPQDHEVFSLPLKQLREVLVDLRTRTPVPTEDYPLPATVVWRAGEVIELEWYEASSGRLVPRVRPGDVVVIDSSSAAFSPRRAGSTTPQVPVTAADLGQTPSTTHDVLATDDHGTGRSGSSHVARLEPGSRESWDSGRWQELPMAIEDAGEDLRRLRRAVRDWLGTSRAASDVTVTDGLKQAIHKNRVDVIVHRDGAGGLVRVVVRSNLKAVYDDERRQEWLPVEAPVTLDAHQRAVGHRAAAVARVLHLEEPLVRALEVAGKHHDDGKCDPRFQVRLEAPGDGPLLAKSIRARRWQGRAGRAPDASGLPSDWRHEQLSVALAWAELVEDDHIDADLVTRLIGTTHGRGRPSFPHTASDLVRDGDATTVESAQLLFDEGEWDAVVERTQVAYGPWACAYLEGLLRAADGQVSMEGS